MISIGYALFEDLIRQEARRLEGIETGQDSDVRVEIPGDSFIPPSYVPDVAERVRIYRNVWRASCESDIDEWIDYLSDRFGEPEESVLNCAKRARIGYLARKACIEEVVISGSLARMVFSPGTEVSRSSPDNLKISVTVEKTGRKVATGHVKGLSDSEKVIRTLSLLRYLSPE